jgi:hypothetical protein
VEKLGTFRRGRFLASPLGQECAPTSLVFRRAHVDSAMQVGRSWLGQG